MKPVVTFNGVPLDASQIDALRNALVRAPNVAVAPNTASELLKLLDQHDESRRRRRADHYRAFCAREAAARRVDLMPDDARAASDWALACEVLDRARAAFYAEEWP